MLNDPMSIMILSFLLGAVHLFTGMGIKIYMLAKRGHLMDGLMDVGLWYLILIGLPMMVLPAVANVGKILAIVGAVGLILTQGRHEKNILMKPIKGVMSLYDITGYLSDVLSYSRVLALGLAGGMVVEDEADFQQFLEHNHQYWDYVDDELEQKFAGVSRIKCYLSDDAEGKAILAAIRAAFSNNNISTAFIEDSDWENNWREYYKPIEVGEKLVVVPEWEEIPENGRLPLRLDPGLIFGTGSHATTRMCLAALEKYCSSETRVLDLGCGSGILGIGSLVLGNKCCVGCDIDPKAPDVAMANAALNGIGAERFKVYAGDMPEHKYAAQGPEPLHQ